MAPIVSLFRRRPPAPPLTLATEPVLRAGAETTITLDADAQVHLRLLGWDMRRARKWPLGDLRAGTHRVGVPAGLPPGCARMTEYAVVAERAGRVVAERVGLVGDEVWWPGDERGDVVPLGGVLRGHADGAGEVGAELHTAGTAMPRFLPVTTVEGAYAVTIGPDVPPTLHDGEDLGIAWVVRTGTATRRFAVIDPEGAASDRRPSLLTFLAQLSRDPFAFGA